MSQKNDAILDGRRKMLEKRLSKVQIVSFAQFHADETLQHIRGVRHVPPWSLGLTLPSLLDRDPITPLAYAICQKHSISLSEEFGGAYLQYKL